MVSRRDALRALATTTSVGVAGCVGFDPLSGPNDDPPDAVGTDWTPPDGTWALSAAGPRNTRRSALPVQGEPTVAWHARRPSDADKEPPGFGVVAATPETVYTSVDGSEGRDVTIQARAAADGRVRWRASVDGVRDGGVVGETLYASAGGPAVYALDVTDGTVRWRVDAYARLAAAVPERYLPPEPTDLYPRVLPTPETVYVATSYGLHGLAPADGTERWRAYVPREKVYDVLVSGGTAVVEDAVVSSYGYESTTVAKLFDGRVRTADVPFDGPLPLSAPTFVDDQLCVTLGPIDTKLERSPVAAGYDISPFPRGYDNEVHGDDLAWQYPGLDAGRGPTQLALPATDGQRLFLVQLTPAGDRFRVGTVALDPSDATLAWLHETPVEGDSPDADETEGPGIGSAVPTAVGTPAVAGDAVLVGLVTSVANRTADAADGRLLALDAADGRERWRVPVGVVPKEVVVAGDRIYVAGRRGGLVALDRTGRVQGVRPDPNLPNANEAKGP